MKLRGQGDEHLAEIIKAQPQGQKADEKLDGPDAPLKPGGTG